MLRGFSFGQNLMKVASSRIDRGNLGTCIRIFTIPLSTPIFATISFFLAWSGKIRFIFHEYLSNGLPRSKCKYYSNGRLGQSNIFPPLFSPFNFYPCFCVIEIIDREKEKKIASFYYVLFRFIYFFLIHDCRQLSFLSSQLRNVIVNIYIFRRIFLN